MKPSFGPDSYERSSFLTNGVADLMTSLAVIFILLFAAYVTRVEDGNVKPDLNRTAPLESKPRIDPLHPRLEAQSPSILTATIPDRVLNFEFGKSTLLPSAETFLSEVIPHYATIACGPGGTDVEAFVIEGYTDDLGDDVRNLRLSQDRSFAVLVKSLEVIHEKLPWAYECFLQKATANGRGRQHLLRNDTGHLDREKSRRVMFQIHMRPK